MKKYLVFFLIFVSLLFGLAEKPVGKKTLDKKQESKIELLRKIDDAYQRAMSINFSKAFFEYEKNYQLYLQQNDNSDKTAEGIRFNYLKLRYKYGFSMSEYLESFEKDFSNSQKWMDDRKFFRGVVLFNKSQYPEAEPYLKSVKIGTPYYWDAQKMLTEVYEKMGDFNKALEIYEYLLSSGFKEKDNNYQLYKYKTAILYLKNNQPVEAKNYLNELKDSTLLPPPIIEDIQGRLQRLN